MRWQSCAVHGEVQARGSGISSGLTNGVLVKAERVCPTPRESLATNILLRANTTAHSARYSLILT